LWLPVHNNILRVYDSLSLTSPLLETVVPWLVLKEFFRIMRSCELVMFKGNSGKLMVYASTGAPGSKRLASVRTATQETAKRLNLDFKMVKLDRAGSPIYVYYEETDSEDPIPLYCDEGKMSDTEGICSVLRNMMFVLSFHPKHSALKQMRKEILKLS